MVKRGKKAQGLPIDIIILAAIALLVLVVVIAIFSGQTRRTVLTLGSCNGIGGGCRANQCLPNEAPKRDVKCDTTTDVCCIKVFEETK